MSRTSMFDHQRRIGLGCCRFITDNSGTVTDEMDVNAFNLNKYPTDLIKFSVICCMHVITNCVTCLSIYFVCELRV